jgi:hypothetical protein
MCALPTAERSPRTVNLQTRRRKSTTEAAHGAMPSTCESQQRVSLQLAGCADGGAPMSPSLQNQNAPSCPDSTPQTRSCTARPAPPGLSRFLPSLGRRRGMVMRKAVCGPATVENVAAGVTARTDEAPPTMPRGRNARRRCYPNPNMQYAASIVRSRTRGRRPQRVDAIESTTPAEYDGVNRAIFLGGIAEPGRAKSCS